MAVELYEKESDSTWVLQKRGVTWIIWYLRDKTAEVTMSIYTPVNKIIEKMNY